MTPLPLILRRLAASSSFALGFKVMALPLGYFTLMTSARLFGAQQTGTFAIATYLVATVSVCCRLGLDTGLLRFFAAMQAEGQGGLGRLLRPALALVLAVSSLAAALMYGWGAWLASRFHAPDLPAMLSFVVPALPLSVAAGLCGEGLRALGGVRWVVFSQDFFAPAILLSLILLLAHGGGWLSPPQALGLAFLISTIAALGLVALGLRAYLRSPGAAPGRRNLRDLLGYSWPFFFSSILMLAFGSLDSLILGVFQAPENVAYYEAAAKSAMIISLPLIAVNAAAPPLFAQFHQRGDLPGLEKLAQATSRWMYYAALPLTLLGLAAAPELLSFFGPGFAGADAAFRLLALGQLVNVACGSVGFILAMTGHQLTLTLVLALAGAVGIPLMAGAAAFYGLTGLAAAKSLWLIGVNVLMSLGVWRHLRITAFAHKVGWVNLAGLAGFAFFVIAKPYVGWLGGTACFLLVYAVGLGKILRQEISGLIRLPQWEALK
jgi:O-antigen/teichoic acid export membrane protein